MQTTNLFVELIVIGFGAVIWLSLILLSVFGYAWIPFNQVLSLPALVPIVAASYILGIVVDRLTDSASSYWDGKLRDQHFTDQQVYQNARTIIYSQSTSLKDWFQYGRSRLRICRGWIFNALLCLCSLLAFIWIRLPENSPRIRLTIAGFLFFSSLAISFAFAWYKLTNNEYLRLSKEYESFVQSGYRISVKDLVDYNLSK